MNYLLTLAFVASAFAQSGYNDTTTVTAYFTGCSTLPVGNLSMTLAVLTTYTTVYEETCSTGLAPVTYTITEKCSTADQPRPTDYLPNGFVVTTVACAPCQEATVTLTTPAKVPTAAAVPLITPVPVYNTSAVCHTCNQTITSIQYGNAPSLSLGLSFVSLFTFIAGAVILI